ncbi:VOC family protein [Streptomyces sp. URMC 123]|uniref:VOC family protein n=1 Tax=Streptomyces sp. URMC 123 TaxID=3423403 RepID=UPI003F1AE71A
MMGEKQVKVGLRVRDLDRSRDLYLRLGFREIPNDDKPTLRYLTYGRTWVILSDMYAHGYERPEEAEAVRKGPRGLGFVLALPTPDLDRAYAVWRSEGLPVITEPEDTEWARIFTGLDPDGYEILFEQFHAEYRPSGA